MDLTISDAQLATKLAVAAGDRLLELQRTSGLLGKALGQAGDRVSHACLINALRLERPSDSVRSEEANEADSIAFNSRLWIIDPLDGTREYGEGRDDWAVHVGLAVEGIAVVGAVALPGRDEVHSTLQPLHLADAPKRPRMVVSRSRPSPDCLNVANILQAELIEMGSAGAKAMAVLRGEADIYLHSGGQYEWDSCAPAAVAAAHGLHVSRANGKPLKYGSDDPWLPDLLICHPRWKTQVLSAWKTNEAKMGL